MTDIESRTRQLADDAGLRTGRHEVDGRDLVSLFAGWVANKCAHAADAGGRLPQMTFALMDAMEEWGTPTEQRFAGAIAKLCHELAAQRQDAPGDAIRDAFNWSGWCHDGIHGSGTLFFVRINGQGVPDAAQRKSLETAFAGVLLREFVTSEAIDEGYKAARKTDPNTYWARRWKTARAMAMNEVFPDGLPPRMQLRTVFTYSPW